MKSLFIVNDPPYGTERVYNALRLAHALVKREPSMQVTIFLMADAVLAGKAQQKTPDGYYNVERMLKRILSNNGVIQVSPLMRTRQIFAIRALWLIMPLAFVSYAVVAAVRGLWIAPYLMQVHQFDANAVGLSATAMGFALALGGIFYAPLHRMVGDAKVTVATGVAVTVVAWLVLGLSGHLSGLLALVLLFIVACFGASFPIVLAHSRAFLPTHLFGQGVTMINLLFFGGAGVGQWLSGRYVKASETVSVAPDVIYGRLFIAFSLILAVALFIYMFAPSERRSSEV